FVHGARLPKGDHTPVPDWFKRMLRASMPRLPKRGPHQYPRWAKDLYEWMLENPSLDPGQSSAAPAAPAPAGNGVWNLSGQHAWNVEPFVAVDPARTTHLVAAANGKGRVDHFVSTDRGQTWHASASKVQVGGFQTDPALTFGPDGRAWSATMVW